MHIPRTICIAGEGDSSVSPLTSRAGGGFQCTQTFALCLLQTAQVKLKGRTAFIFRVAHSNGVKKLKLKPRWMLIT